MNLLTQRKRLPGQALVCAFGGGGGGAGRTTTVAELSRHLMRKGRKVVVVDADLTNPALTTTLGIGLDQLQRLSAGTGRDAQLRDYVIPATKQRPATLSLGHAAVRVYEAPDTRPEALVAKLQALPFDIVLIDLPAQPSALWATVFVMADVPIVIANMESSSVLASTRFMRWALLYGLASHPDASSIERRIVDCIRRVKIDDNIDGLRRACDPSDVSSLLRTVLGRLETYLIITKARDSAERDLTQVLALSWYYVLGMRPRVLGAIDHDDRLWFHKRQHKHDHLLSSDEGAGVQCEDIAKRLLAIHELDADQPRAAPAAGLSPHELLGVPHKAQPLHVRSAYRKLWEGFRRESAITSVLIASPMRQRILVQLEEANRSLQTWLAERGSTLEPIEAPRPRLVDRASPGEPVREARQLLEISVRELSLRTKIGIRYLEAIESFDVENLPRPAYLRGYLREIARVLDLDGDLIMNDYLSKVADVRSGRILRRALRTSEFESDDG